MTACIAVSNFIAEYFLHPGDPLLRRQAASAAANYLDMDEIALFICPRYRRGAPSCTEELFEIRLLDPIEVDALMKEARDLQTLRQLSRDMELERSALRDSLTGAYNRGYLETILQREFELATRNHWPLSVAMIDVDHLKNINMLYGHSVGDAVLVSIVRTMQKKIRPDDVLARFIGENFVLVMPGASLDAARQIIERLQESIGLIEHAQDRGTSIKATVSIGLAAHMDGGVQFDLPDAIIQAVEEALLQDKHTGPNRVSTWSEHS